MAITAGKKLKDLNSSVIYFGIAIGVSVLIIVLAAVKIDGAGKGWVIALGVLVFFWIAGAEILKILQDMTYTSFVDSTRNIDLVFRGDRSKAPLPQTRLT